MSGSLFVVSLASPYRPTALLTPAPDAGVIRCNDQRMVLASNNHRRSAATIVLFIVATLFLLADIALVLLAVRTVL